MKDLILVEVMNKNAISLLGTEGPVVSVRREGDEFVVKHEIHNYEEKMSGPEVIEFFQGKKTIELPNHIIVDLRIYPADMKPKLEEVEEFVKDSRIKSITYLASPYTHSDKEIVEERFRTISQISAEMTAQGLIAISPITYGHTLLEFKDMPGSWEFWTSFCLSLLDKCDSLTVMKMDGWDKSTGIAEEIKYAEEHGIPVYYEDPQKYLG